jgi:hypothetical protein
VSTVKTVLASVAGALLAASALIAPTAAQAAPLVNVLVTDDAGGTYLRYDGGTDSTMAACSSGRRSQNEPTVAVDPRNPDVVVAGSNDYCAQIVNGDVWAG